MKKLFFCLVIILGLITFVSFVSAQNLGGSLLDRAGTNAGYNPQTDQYTFSQTLGTVVKAALSFVGVIFMILAVYAGFLWMTAREDTGKAEDAQKILRAAVIGFALTMGAWSITAFVIPKVLERTGGTARTTTPVITPGS